MSGPHPPDPTPTDDTPATDEAPSDAPAEAAADAPGIDASALALATELDKVREKQRETEARLRAVSKAYVDLKQEKEAEMAAFRARVEAQDQVKLARREFELAQVFFAPVENLRRSLDTGVGDVDAFVEGIRLVHQQFAEGLRKLGLAPIPGVGSPFDPALHEALALAPVDDEAQDGRVILVHEDGYMVGGRALQPAKVVVGRYEPGATEPEA